MRSLQKNLSDEVRGVKEAKNQESNRCSVPKGDQKHDERHVNGSSEVAFVDPSERIEDVISHPGHQGDVPALPDIAEANGRERCVKIWRQREAETITDSHGAGRIASEIAIVLACKRECPSPSAQGVRSDFGVED